METEEELNKCIEIVQKILKDNETARNDDKFLVWKFWSDYDKVKIYIPLDDFYKLTPIESITRARRFVQNENGLYLPTKPIILVKRRIKEEQVRSYFADKQAIINKWEELYFKIN